MPKGEKVLSLKQKDRTTNLKLSKKEMFISIGISFGFKILISIEISIGIISFGIYFKKINHCKNPLES
jgi:hypothetical protein